jgi:hypothetical protein
MGDPASRTCETIAEGENFVQPDGAGGGNNIRSAIFSVSGTTQTI